MTQQEHDKAHSETEQGKKNEESRQPGESVRCYTESFFTCGKKVRRCRESSPRNYTNTKFHRPPTRHFRFDI
ncbi:hypothetical protein RUM43_009427 [Polyplax serrata]|uniref:Uncharacterized protein n=1 Tax=Polyplax serrata TaxID=468196 RepID=A0AAN8NPI7_POLSC